MVKYYDMTGIVPLDEQQEFWKYMRTELPNSFRFCGSKGHALSVMQRLVDLYIPQIISVKYEGESVEPPKQLSWFPEKLAWDMTTPKNVVRRFPPFASFQKFLVSETSVGNISRQEVVSMIPPLLMDIKPNMTVLDMCAAPGSKTAQLIEAIHSGEEARVRRIVKQLAKEAGRETSPDGFEIEAEKDQAGTEEDYSDDGRSTGLLIANDVELKRAQMLVHQVKRLNSPNIIITNHDATMFPSIKIGGQGSSTKYLKFDRILADVPCSGDGTLRKNLAIWKDWTPGNGIGLHAVQVKILIRALQMLKVGGRVVYSTCSLNPLENEAVVASAIDRCGGSEKVRLIDCKDELPGLERRPGLKTWHVMDKTEHIWKSIDELERARESREPPGAERIVAGMFPPSEDEQVPLERCMRIYPHLQDTGAFFICVLEKQSEIRTRAEGVPKPKPKIEELERQEEQPTKDTDPEGGVRLESTAATNGEANGTGSRRRDREEDDNADHPAKVRKTDKGPMVDQIPDSKPVEDDEPRAVDDNECGSQTPASVVIKTTTTSETAAMAPAPGSFQKRSSKPVKEEPFFYLKPDHPELANITKFYELHEKFPRDRFLVRNEAGEPAKGIYFTSTLARTILELNAGKGMKFVWCGVKMFVKQDSQGEDICRWRIQSDGLPIIEPWVGETRILRLYKKSTLHKLLIEMFPKVAGESWKELGEIGEFVRDMTMGCSVLRVEASDDDDGFKSVARLYRTCIC